MPYLPNKQPKRSYMPGRKRTPGTNQAFYNATQWRKVRARYRKKVGLICEACKYEGQQVSEPRMPVDHIVPIDRGGDPYDEDNLNLLCISHHEQKSAKERHKGGSLVDWVENRRGYKVPDCKSDIWEILTK